MVFLFATTTTRTALFLVSLGYFGAVTAFEQQLQHTMNRELQAGQIDAAIVCSVSNNSDQCSQTVDGLTTTYTLPAVSGADAVVSIFPHIDETVTSSYYQGGCTAAIDDTVFDRFSESNLDNYSGPTPAPFGTSNLAKILLVNYPLVDLQALPAPVRTTDTTANPYEHEIRFCLRVALEGGAYRETDVTVELTGDTGATTPPTTPPTLAALSTIDNNPGSGGGEFGLGDFTVETVVCKDTPGIGNGLQSNPLRQGEAIAICLVPKKGTAQTTEIILERITDFTMETSFTPKGGLLTTGLSQSVYVGGVLQANSEVGDFGGNACALGVGAQTGTSPSVVSDATIHGCRFETIFVSAIYEQFTGDITVTASGTVTMSFSSVSSRSTAMRESQRVDFYFTLASPAKQKEEEDSCFLNFLNDIPIIEMAAKALCMVVRMIMRVFRQGSNFFEEIF